MVVGIPRGFFYYKYSPLWKAFFDELGVETVVSPETNRAILDRGIQSCVSEACLPLKAYFGHALALAGKADLLFVPRFMSVAAKEYICPKFGGLPDMVRCLDGLPELLAPEVNRHDRDDGGLRAAWAAGKRLGVRKAKATVAYDRALLTYRAHRAAMVGKPLGNGSAGVGSSGDGRALRVLLLGHSYVVGDRFLNMDIVRRLNALGVTVLPMEYFDGRELRRAAGPMEKPMFWTYGTEVMGLAYLLGERKAVDGVLQLSCFGCGVDSFVGYLMERRLRGTGISLATVSLDEHTGEAGLQTRLEAFADTLMERRAGA